MAPKFAEGIRGESAYGQHHCSKVCGGPHSGEASVSVAGVVVLRGFETGPSHQCISAFGPAASSRIDSWSWLPFGMNFQHHESKISGGTQNFWRVPAGTPKFLEGTRRESAKPGPNSPFGELQKV